MANDGCGCVFVLVVLLLVVVLLHLQDTPSVYTPTHLRHRKRKYSVSCALPFFQTQSGRCASVPVNGEDLSQLQQQQQQLYHHQMLANDDVTTTSGTPTTSRRIPKFQTTTASVASNPKDSSQSRSRSDSFVSSSSSSSSSYDTSTNNNDDPVVVDPTKVLIISEGRSGSTLLMKMLADLNNTMILFEPFHDFSPEAWNGEQGPPIPGGISSFFNCEFARMGLDVLNGVFWWPVRMEAWLPTTDTEYNYTALVWRAWEHQLNAQDAEQIYSACMRTERRVLKLIRFSGYVMDSFYELPAAEREAIQVVHLMRDLPSVVRSQEKVDWGDRATLVHVLCSHMEEQLPFLKQHPAILTVDYNVLMFDPVSVVRRISLFIGARPPRSKSTLTWLDSSQDVYRDMKALKQLNEGSEDDDEESRARTDIKAMLHHECHEAATAFEALIWVAQTSSSLSSRLLS